MQPRDKAKRTLSAGIQKLRKRRVKQLIPLPEWAVITQIRLELLRLHICVRDLRDVREEEHAREAEDENCDREIHPLHVLQGLDVVACVFEEGVCT